jgi:hypothetical protein
VRFRAPLQFRERAPVSGIGTLQPMLAQTTRTKFIGGGLDPGRILQIKQVRSVDPITLAGHSRSLVDLPEFD